MNKKNCKTKIAVIGLSGKSVFLSVDHFHSIGETVVAKDIYIEAGGKGYNQAITCKRLGADVCFFTILGNDSNGKYCLEQLNKEKVKTFLVTKKGQTAYANILTDKNGENQVTVFPGITTELVEKDLEMFYNTMLSCNYILIQLEIPIEITKRIIDIANKNNIKVILNTAPAIEYIEEFNDVFLLIPNYQEAMKLFNVSKEKLLDKIKEQKINRMVITNGNQGCIVIENGAIEYINAYKTKPVDTTGAGDVFNGAVCVALANGKTLIEAAKFATVASSIAVERKYAEYGIPTLEEVEERMKKYGN